MRTAGNWTPRLLVGVGALCSLALVLFALQPLGDAEGATRARLELDAEARGRLLSAAWQARLEASEAPAAVVETLLEVALPVQPAGDPTGSPPSRPSPRVAPGDEAVAESVLRVARAAAARGELRPCPRHLGALSRDGAAPERRRRRAPAGPALGGSGRR